MTVKVQRRTSELNVLMDTYVLTAETSQEISDEIERIMGEVANASFVPVYYHRSLNCFISVGEVERHH